MPPPIVSRVPQILAAREHRPFPLPSGPWLMTQAWNRLLFAHWPIAPEIMRAHVPRELELDLRDGQAWIAVTPFYLNDLALRILPNPPGLSQFPELNVRTYVTHHGIGGVFFFSLDAGSWPAVIGARTVYGLPYFHSDMLVRRQGNDTLYRLRRRGSARATQFAASYRPVSPVRHSAPGSMEYFLTERYCLYVVRGGRVWRANIHHPPWPLQQAAAEIVRNTMADAEHIELPAIAPVLHYAERIEVLVWPPDIAR